MAGAGALTFRNGGQTVRDRYAAQMTILTRSGSDLGWGRSSPNVSERPGPGIGLGAVGKLAIEAAANRPAIEEA